MKRYGITKFRGGSSSVPPFTSVHVTLSICLIQNNKCQLHNTARGNVSRSPKSMSCSVREPRTFERKSVAIDPIEVEMFQRMRGIDRLYWYVQLAWGVKFWSLLRPQAPPQHSGLHVWRDCLKASTWCDGCRHGGFDIAASYRRYQSVCVWTDLLYWCV